MAKEGDASSLVPPHGGELRPLLLQGGELSAEKERCGELPEVRLSSRETSDLIMMACGAFSPLEGFMAEADYRSVVDSMRLANGLPWSIPVALSAKSDEHRGLGPGDRLALTDDAGHVLAILEVMCGEDAAADAGSEHSGTSRIDEHLDGIWQVQKRFWKEG